MTISDPSSRDPSQTWKHVKTGKVYRIIAFAIEEKTMQSIVVYETITGGAFSTWTRPCYEFFDGRFEMVRYDGPKTL